MDSRDIVISGYAGAAGARQIAAAKREEMGKRFREEYTEAVTGETEKTGDPALFAELGVASFYPVGEGGVLAALYRMCRERKIGLKIAMKRIPVLQSTVEIAELFGLNPYRLYSRGWVLLTENGARLSERLREEGIPAERIGILTEGPGKMITDKTETEYLNKPAEDELYKVLPDVRL